MLQFDPNPGANESIESSGNEGSAFLNDSGDDTFGGSTDDVQGVTHEALQDAVQEFPDKYIQAFKDLETVKRFLIKEGLPEKDLYVKEVLSVIDVSKDDERVMVKRLFLKGHNEPLTYDVVINGVRTTHLAIDTILLLLRLNQSQN